MSPFILIDDANLTLLIGAQWERIANSTGAHNRTATICRTELNSRGGRYIREPQLTINLPSLNAVTFVGTGVPEARLNYSFQMDKSDLRQAEISPPRANIGKTGVELWTLNNADAHRLTIQPDFGEFILDYVLITPDRDQDFNGNTMVFDDRDTAIKYDSQWTPDEDAELPDAVPMRGTLTRAVTTGAKFDLQFTGDSIAVYGALNTVAGRLASSYSVDNGTATEVTHFDGTQTVNRDEWRVGQQFFRQNMSPGTHTLTVTLTEATGNQTFNLDYITFGGIETTQLNSTEAGSGRPATIGGIAGGIIGAILILACIGGYRRKYYVVKRTYWFW